MKKGWKKSLVGVAALAAHDRLGQRGIRRELRRPRQHASFNLGRLRRTSSTSSRVRRISSPPAAAVWGRFSAVT